MRLQITILCGLVACADPPPGGGPAQFSTNLDGDAAVADAAHGADSGETGRAAACVNSPPFVVCPDAAAGDAQPVDAAVGDSAPSDTAKPETTVQDDVAKPDIAPVDTTKPVASPVTSPSCLDGQWQEALPNPKASLTALKQGYTQSKLKEFVLGALDLRYPLGKVIVEGGLKKADCIGQFVSAQQKSSASGVVSAMGTVVHECGHYFDLSKGGFANSGYVFTGDVSYVCTGAAMQGSNASFARSLIKQDEYAKLWKPCNNFGEQGCDSYAAIYLDGDPKDAKFDSGDQGFNMLLEEVVQYVNSLATGYAFEDQYQWSVSERDGILTFFWYLERYLRLARLQYPKVHQYLLGNECWRKAILTVWGRGWMYLELTKNSQKLTIKGPFLEKLVLDAELLSEIALVRQAHGCP
jgi:hypothetical protein